MTTEIDITTLLGWSEPVRVETKHGSRMLRKAKPTESFWRVWRSDKEALKEMGISLSTDKKTGEWVACWWQPVPREVLKAEQAAIQASKASEADVRIPAPDGLEYLPYQKAGIAFAAGRTGCLIGDEMGLGKTIQAIGVINSDPEIRKVIVVCPATLKLNWFRELDKWLTRDLKVAVQDPQTGWVGTSANVVIINYDILKKFSHNLTACQWDLRVVDEAHMIKNPKAARTKQVMAIQASRKISMTGTPMANRPAELFPIIHDLDPETWPKFFPFAKRYCDAKHNGYGWDLTGASRLDELQRKLRSTIMVRRLKSDVLTELPAKRRQVIELSADPSTAPILKAEQEALDRHEDHVSALQADVELAKASDDPEAYKRAVQALRQGVGAQFEEMSRIRQEIAIRKVPQVTDHVRESLEQGKVVLFAHHREVIKAYEEAFSGHCVKVVGGMGSEEKQAAVDAFQDDPSITVFIGSITAAGTGITLTASSHVIFGELDWVPGNLTQCEDRTHRIGQHDSVLVQHLVLEGSLDAVMAKRITRKQEVIDQALDRDAPEKDEPVAPTRHRITVTTNEMAQAPNLTADQIDAIHRGLKILAGQCNWADTLDGAGFSKVDVRIGHSLAEAPVLTAKQAVIGRRLVNKYRRQLPAEIIEIATATVTINKT